MISDHIRAGLVDLEQQLPSDSADCSDLCLGNKRGEGREQPQGRRDAASGEAPALDKGGKRSLLQEGREVSEHQPTASAPPTLHDDTEGPPRINSSSHQLQSRHSINMP